jgi:hypothetical protein
MGALAAAVGAELSVSVGAFVILAIVGTMVLRFPIVRDFTIGKISPSPG